LPAKAAASGSARLDVKKTYKLFIGGKFPRSESGRSYVVTDARDRFLANAAQASRKDARDAVSAARKAFAGWATTTPYNRGQVLYRVAEVMESRRDQFVADIAAGEGVTRPSASKAVDLAIDRWVWYAGWADKIAQVVGSTNPVAGPYFDFSVPEPTGVVAVLAPQGSSLLGLVSVLAPVIVSGNAAVVTASYRRPLPAITMSEVLATSDVPAGVVNVLTGQLADTVPTLASHQDVNAIDLAGAAGDAENARLLEVAAVDNLKRVLRADDVEPDWTLDPGLSRITRFLETKTVWHPMGL
jgi:acyl-CoA reductase-like NAD-dependent aldehyde dehydrogenase